MTVKANILTLMRHFFMLHARRSLHVIAIILLKMMLSRNLGVTLSRHAINRMRNVSTATAIAAAGAVYSWNQHSVTKLEASHNTQQPLSSLIIPTLEATIRAQRLVYTAFMVVMDYESAKLGAYLGLEQGSAEKVKWLEERSKRQDALERSQKDYTDESYSSDLKPDEYREIKLAQRQQVLTAAERLAEAEEVLEEIGGNEVHLRAANRLLQLCQKNGGVYIKIGQHLV